jgi:hypothetical protein
MMKKTVARFVTRFQGENDGLFIGALTNGGKGVLKPNTIYEIQEILGQLVIVEIGMACGAGTDNCLGDKYNSPGVMFHWGSDIGDLIASYGGQMFLSAKEYVALLADRLRS